MTNIRGSAASIAVFLLFSVLAAGLCTAAPLTTADHLVISQFLVKTRTPYTTFGSPFVAITNPTGADIDLSNVYLTDATLMPSALYTKITLSSPSTADPGGGSGGDFHAKFPDGYVLPAGATISIALSGSAQYATAYGRQPDFELYEDYYIPDTVSELVAAFPGSINAGLVGGGSNVPALSDVAESIVLYQWDGIGALVQDIDYVAWGTNTSSRVDKTGLTVGGQTYQPDTSIASQVMVAAAGPTFGHVFKRVSADEGTETPTGGNGVTGHNETSENLSSTWADVVGSTPPPAPASYLPSAPIFTAAVNLPATPWVDLAVPLSVTVQSNSVLTGVTFHYNVDGGAYADSAGVYAGNNVWTAVVPGQAGNAVVKWYATATNAAGRSATTPTCAPRYTKGWTVATAPPAAELRKSPYTIWLGDPTTMQVLWQTPSTWPCTFEWGTDTSYALGSVQTQEFGPDHQHTQVLTGLTPGQLYKFRVNYSGTLYTGSFRAAPDPSSTTLKFVAYGDTRTNGLIHNQVVGQMLHSVDVDPARQTLIVSVGDMVTNGDDEKSWDNEYFSSAYPNLRRMGGMMPFQACMGNHEDSGSVYMKYFPYPYAGARYWSYDYGPAHFTYIDQYVNYSPGSPQYAWIENDLATTTKPWRIVVLHEPGWSAGGGHANNTEVQDYLQPLFVKYGVAIVFCGHNHYYARAVVDGVQHITTGGGGAPLYGPDYGAPNVVTAIQTFQYCRVTIDGSHLGFASANGAAVLDTFMINRSAAAEPAPAALSQLKLQASPNPFNPRTTIRFELPTAGHVKLAVYDLAGALVRTLLDGERPAGAGEIAWDGCDANGRGMPSSTYFACLEAGGASRTARMSLVR